MLLDARKAPNGIVDERPFLSLAHFSGHGWYALGRVDGPILRSVVRRKSRRLCYNSEVCERPEKSKALFCLRDRAGRGVQVLRAARRGEAGDRRVREESFRR